jgi:hypothetical protein
MPMRVRMPVDRVSDITYGSFMSGVTLSCLYCGEPFAASRRWHRFCKSDCHDDYHARLTKLVRDVLPDIPLVSVASVSITLYA